MTKLNLTFADGGFLSTNYELRSKFQRSELINAYAEALKSPKVKIIAFVNTDNLIDSKPVKMRMEQIQKLFANIKTESPIAQENLNYINNRINK